MLSVVFLGTHRDKYDGGLNNVWWSRLLWYQSFNQRDHTLEYFAWRKALASMRILRRCICLEADIDIVRVLLFAMSHERETALFNRDNTPEKRWKVPSTGSRTLAPIDWPHWKKDESTIGEKSAQIHTKIAKIFEPQPPWSKAPRIDSVANHCYLIHKTVSPTYNPHLLRCRGGRGRWSFVPTFAFSVFHTFLLSTITVAIAIAIAIGCWD